MLCKNNKAKNEVMYLAYCDVFNLKTGYKCRVGEILFKNKKDAEKWMKDIRENYIKDDSGNLQKNWIPVNYMCYNADGCEYYTVEHKEPGEWTWHELTYRPIKFTEI